MRGSDALQSSARLLVTGSKSLAGATILIDERYFDTLVTHEELEGSYSELSRDIIIKLNGQNELIGVEMLDASAFLGMSCWKSIQAKTFSWSKHKRLNTGRRVAVLPPLGDVRSRALTCHHIRNRPRQLQHAMVLPR